MLWSLSNNDDVPIYFIVQIYPNNDDVQIYPNNDDVQRLMEFRLCSSLTLGPSDPAFGQIDISIITHSLLSSHTHTVYNQATLYSGQIDISIVTHCMCTLSWIFWTKWKTAIYIVHKLCVHFYMVQHQILCGTACKKQRWK